MVDFKKGHWNIAELEIVEWIDPKQKGFIAFDVETLKNKIINDINKLIGDDEPSSEIIDIINKRFGFDE